MDRRQLITAGLSGILLAATAPAFVKSGVMGLWIPKPEPRFLYCQADAVCGTDEEALANFHDTAKGHVQFAARNYGFRKPRLSVHSPAEMVPLVDRPGKGLQMIFMVYEG